jgi:hypothetical protein
MTLQALPRIAAEMSCLRVRTLAPVALLGLAACLGGRGGQAPHPSPAATDPIAFPLFAGAEILSSRAWRQTVTAAPNVGDRAVFAQGRGTYDGHDVVAGTQALMPSLEAWLNDLGAHPPAGYTLASAGPAVDAVRAHTQELGVDFAAFENTQNGKRHAVVVLAVDPQTLGERAGPMLGLVERFRLMPRMLRDPIDAQVKRETGFTLTEATDPDTPIGAAVAALDELRSFGGRGIVVIDAVKQ